MLPYHMDDVKLVGLLALLEDVCTSVEAWSLTADDEAQMTGIEVLQERVLCQDRAKRLGLHGVSPLCWGSWLHRCPMARTSSVISIATGHQVMQRPQPTQPEVPNWSIQVANLCVSHWR